MTKSKKSSKPTKICKYCGKKYTTKHTHCPVLRKLEFLQTPNGIIVYELWCKYSSIIDRRYNRFTHMDCVKHFSFKYLVGILDLCNRFQSIDAFKYFDFLIKYDFKITQWCDEKTIELYLNQLILYEDMMDGVEKTLININQWALDNKQKPQNFFKEVSENRLCQWIKNGKISPWFIYLSEPNKILVQNKIKNDTLHDISKVMNESHWTVKVATHPESMKIRKLLMENGF